MDGILDIIEDNREKIKCEERKAAEFVAEEIRVGTTPNNTLIRHRESMRKMRSYRMNQCDEQQKRLVLRYKRMSTLRRKQREDEATKAEAILEARMKAAAQAVADAHGTDVDDDEEPVTSGRKREKTPKTAARKAKQRRMGRKKRLEGSFFHTYYYLTK